MLVLTRRVDESVVIGTGPDAVVVTVVRVDRGAVRLGVAAPKSVSVLRSELAPRAADPPPPEVPSES